jgi:hypothetical protein
MDGVAGCFFLLCHALELVHLRDSTAEVIAMSLREKAIISGVVIEGVLFSLMYADGWGPCAPNTQLGVVTTLLQIPGVIIAAPFAWLPLPSILETPIFFVCSSLFWTLISYAVLRTRSKH